MHTGTKRPKDCSGFQIPQLFTPNHSALVWHKEVEGGYWNICLELEFFPQWLPGFWSISVTCFSQSPFPWGIISFALILPLIALYPLITNPQIGKLGCCLYLEHHFLMKLITLSINDTLPPHPTLGSLSPIKRDIWNE